MANFDGLFGTEFDERALARSSHAHDGYVDIIRTASMKQVSTMGRSRDGMKVFISRFLVCAFGIIIRSVSGECTISLAGHVR